MMSSSFRWGDVEDEEVDVLPPRKVVGPDEKGIKIITSWRRDEDTGKLIKVIETVRVTKKTKKMSPAVLHRKQLKRFGDVANATEGVTLVSVDEIRLEKPGSRNTRSDNVDLGLPSSGNTSLIVCRACGKKGDHWTSRCPFKDLLLKDDDAVIKPAEDHGDRGDVTSKQSTGKYVAPNRRPGGGAGSKETMRYRDDGNSLRVTNLSEDTREADLQELFGRFGSISRIFVASDRGTGLGRGFAFITFVRREDAERAMKKLDGYGYDSLILHVEWAAPRERPVKERNDHW